MPDNQLAATACSRCREQKLRCSREQPVCGRCLRLHGECSYPSPPDRKLLATLRSTTKKRKVVHESSQGNQTSSKPAHRADQASLDTSPDSDISPDSSTWYVDPYSISSNAQRVLIDVYFECVFNNSLIFHRATFEKDLARRDLPQHTLFAVYAMATRFLIPSSERLKHNGEHLSHLGDLQCRGRSWALHAGKKVLQSVDEPDFASIQTCEVLSLYWFSQGDSQRNTMFCGIAQRAACARWADIKSLQASAVASAEATHDAFAICQAETARRIFWAAWFTNTINSDHYVVGSSRDARALKLLLPSSESSFHHSAPESLCTLADGLDGKRKSIVGHSSAPSSIMAELIKMNHMWARVRDHIETRKSQPAKTFLADLFSLDDVLVKWATNLPSDLIYNKRTLYSQLVVKQQPSYILLFALYHQCRLILHSSLVPHFSGMALQESTPVEAVQISAHIALKNALAISDLAADLIALDWDPTRVAPFVGYCMYVSASIQIGLMHSPKDRMRSGTRKSLTSCLTVLKLIRPYWRNLQRLWVRVSLLYDAQRAKAATTNISGSSPADLRSELENLDQIINTKREWGQQTEPLEDSVLGYTLQKLKHNVQTHDDMDAARELENLMCLDEVTGLIHDDEGQQSILPTIQPNIGYSMSPGTSNQNRTDVIAPFAPFQQQMHALANDSNCAWWQFDQSLSPQGVLSYEDLFGMTNSL